jgi:phosphate transport system substrate-binding protein
VQQLHGSDTLFDVVTAAITQGGLDSALHYIGGGSGTGETGLRAGSQGLAPMSRALSTAALTDLINQGITPVQNVIGLDGVSLFVNSTNATQSLTFDTIRGIYNCQITDWKDVPGSGKAGLIQVFARNGASGTTDTFKTLITGLPATTVDASGVSQANWGACVHEVLTTEAIADATSTDATAADAIVSVARTATDTAVPADEETIRDFSYPLARRLYINQVTGAREPNENEQALLDLMLDHSFLDPILLQFEFFTCPDSGCP